MKIDLSGIQSFVKIGQAELDAAGKALDTLNAKSGAGAEFTGWLTLPEDIAGELPAIKAAAEKIRSDSQALVVIGIGGSYLGARAALELLRSPNYNALPKDTPDIYFAGSEISGRGLEELLTMLGDRDFSVNVVSKSGTTTEPAIAFRVFRNLLEKKYGDRAGARIYATTDKARGALKTLADAEGWQTFVVPDDVGGRYSVLSAVGLLPMAAAGIDLDAVLSGARSAMAMRGDKSESNPALLYAAARQALYKAGYNTEVLACFEPAFRSMTEWWKQLYGESEGKDQKGIFPAGVSYSTDLHSMGQYIQDGRRELFETTVSVTRPSAMTVPQWATDGDGLGYLAGRTVDEVAEKARQATVQAHISGGVPSIGLDFGCPDERSFGEMVYFFELACGISGYISGVNPFDQPGVEAYKTNMFRLLGKPGY